MKRAIVFLQPGLADWEVGPVAAVLREHLNVEIVTATPGAGPVVSIGGLKIVPDRAFEDVGAEDADIFLLIGSDVWSGFEDEQLFEVLRDALNAGRVVGAICAGTAAAARAGLFENRAHTSNGRDWLSRAVPGYLGSERYQDVSHAVVDGALVSAPGSAPGTFAAAISRLAAPDQGPLIAQYEAMSAKEWSASA